MIEATYDPITQEKIINIFLTEMDVEELRIKGELKLTYDNFDGIAKLNIYQEKAGEIENIEDIMVKREFPQPVEPREPAEQKDEKAEKVLSCYLRYERTYEAPCGRLVNSSGPYRILFFLPWFPNRVKVVLSNPNGNPFVEPLDAIYDVKERCLG